MKNIPTFIQDKGLPLLRGDPTDHVEGRSLIAAGAAPSIQMALCVPRPGLDHFNATRNLVECPIVPSPEKTQEKKRTSGKWDLKCGGGAWSYNADKRAQSRVYQVPRLELQLFKQLRDTSHTSIFTM